jgi:hypothetical protein
MPVQNLSHGKSIRPSKIVSTLQAIPELPEDSDLTSMGASTSVERHIVDVLTTSPDRIPGEFPSDGLSLTDGSWIPYTARIQMLLELDDIPMWHNFLAIISSWLLLGGYMVLPSTFTSIRNSTAFKEGAGKVVPKAVNNLPLLVVGGVCCLIGASSMLRLSWLWRKNYEWLLNRIIM